MRILTLLAGIGLFASIACSDDVPPALLAADAGAAEAGSASGVVSEGGGGGSEVAPENDAATVVTIEEEAGTPTDINPSEVCAGAADVHFRCEPSCAVLERTRVRTVCTSEGWSCPSDHVDIDKCPMGSCVLHQQWCCDQKGLVLELAPCGATGVQTACPNGSLTYDAKCDAREVSSSSCDALESHDCFLAGQECVPSEPTSSPCHCKAEADGALKWSCVVTLP